MFNDQKTLENLDLNELESEYLTFDDTDSFDTNKYKDVILNKLTTVERRIFILYIHSARLKEVASTLNCSTSRVYYLIRDIKNKIKKEVESDYYKTKF